MSKIQQGCTSAIIQNENGEVLFTKRADDEDFLPGVWELPGGGMEYGENPEHSIIREIKEECGLDIEVVKPVSVNDYFMGEIQRIEICYLCRPNSLEVKLNGEHSEFKWVKFDEIDRIEITDYVKTVLNSAKANLA